MKGIFEDDDPCTNLRDTASRDTGLRDTVNQYDKKNQSQSRTTSKLKPTTTQAGADTQNGVGETNSLLSLKGVTEKDTELLALIGTIADEAFIAQVKAEYSMLEAPLEVVFADLKVHSKAKAAVHTLRNWLQGIGRPKGPVMRRQRFSAAIQL